MLEVRRAADRYRGGDRAAGIDTRHAFSFSGFYDPENVGFGLLVACNEERLEPGAGFGLHPHRDLEIVTWVVEGELEHQDSTGAATLVRPGDLQRLGAGSGVRHAERNAGTGVLRFVQMWLVPGSFGGPPGYEVVRGIADATPFAIPRTDAVLHVRRLGDGARTAVPDAQFVHLHVVRGGVRLGGERLGPGDAARVTAADGLVASAHGDTELLLWEMHAEPSYG
ncbi:pirin family protein [Streptomyces sp. DSM 42041]|uniref:Pirin family protein n=1 Tax=Streptomyces hazeniae TaxID=3075538 RepID=A0ABU2NK20_9ACTN|nr:pirin family protein [Streptomyces sp. DSM 42041]MDT0377341.1 pirin family protein [Streptomyces sp. DSM 42041]